MAPQPLYDVYFTGSQGNPRQCIVIGEDVEPVFIRFETPEVFMPTTRTTVSTVPTPTGQAPLRPNSPPGRRRIHC